MVAFDGQTSEDLFVSFRGVSFTINWKPIGEMFEL